MTKERWKCIRTRRGEFVRFEIDPFIHWFCTLRLPDAHGPWMWEARQYVGRRLVLRGEAPTLAVGKRVAVAAAYAARRAA